MSKNKPNRHKPKNKLLIPNILQQFTQHKEFQTPAVETLPDTTRLVEELLQVNRLLIATSEAQKSQPGQALDYALIEQAKLVQPLLRLLTEVTTGVWRTQQRMLRPGSSEPLDEMRRAYRPVQATLDSLRQGGIEIIDRTNQKYSSDFLEKVVAFEASPDLVFDKVIETIKPTLYYQNQVIQQGEIIVGVPHKSENQP